MASGPEPQRQGKSNSREQLRRNVDDECSQDDETHLASLRGSIARDIRAPNKRLISVPPLTYCTFHRMKCMICYNYSFIFHTHSNMKQLFYQISRRNVWDGEHDVIQKTKDAWWSFYEMWDAAGKTEGKLSFVTTKHVEMKCILLLYETHQYGWNLETFLNCVSH